MNRSTLQNRSLHLWFRQLADALNDAGLDMQAVLEAKSVDVPWNEHTVKEVLWRPIQEAMTSEDSTTKVSTKDYPAVHDVLTRHLGEKLGVICPPWPDRFPGAAEYGEGR